MLHQVGILKKANLSTSELAQLADAVEPVTFADGEIPVEVAPAS